MRKEGGGFDGGRGAGDGQKPGGVGHRRHGGAEHGRIQGAVLTERVDGTLGPIGRGGTMVRVGTGGTLQAWKPDDELLASRTEAETRTRMTGETME